MKGNFLVFIISASLIACGGSESSHEKEGLIDVDLISDVDLNFGQGEVKDLTAVAIRVAATRSSNSFEDVFDYYSYPRTSEKAGILVCKDMTVVGDLYDRGVNGFSISKINETGLSTYSHIKSSSFPCWLESRVAPPGGLSSRVLDVPKDDVLKRFAIVYDDKITYLDDISTLAIAAVTGKIPSDIAKDIYENGYDASLFPTLDRMAESEGNVIAFLGDYMRQSNSKRSANPT